MPAPSRDDVKLHLRVDHSDEDALIDGLIAAAQEHLESYLRRDLDDDFPANWPAPVTVACTMLAGVMFREREGGSDEIPPLIKGIVADYRVFS